MSIVDLSTNRVYFYIPHRGILAVCPRTTIYCGKFAFKTQDGNFYYLLFPYKRTYKSCRAEARLRPMMRIKVSIVRKKPQNGCYPERNRRICTLSIRLRVTIVRRSFDYGLRPSLRMTSLCFLWPFLTF